MLPNQAAFDHGDRPGKTRTWWHPLLTRLMDHVLARAYTVQDEVLVGRLLLGQSGFLSRITHVLSFRNPAESRQARRRFHDECDRYLGESLFLFR